MQNPLFLWCIFASSNKENKKKQDVNIQKTLIFSSLLLGGYGIWYAYQISQLNKGVYVKNTHAKMEGGHIIVTIEIYNATSVDVTINGLHVDIFLKQYNIMDAQTTNIVVVQSKKTTNIVVSIVPNWFTIGSTILDEGQSILDDLLLWNIKNLGLIAKGNIFLGKGNINVPFEKAL
jgi:LEA14-like dessication related protein